MIVAHENKTTTVLTVVCKRAAELIVGALSDVFPERSFTIHEWRRPSGYQAYNIDYHGEQTDRAYHSIRYAAKGAAAAIGAPADI